MTSLYGTGYNVGNYGSYSGYGTSTGTDYSSLLNGSTSGLSSLYSSLLGTGSSTGLDGFSSLYGLNSGGTSAYTSSAYGNSGQDLGQMMQQLLSVFQSLMGGSGLGSTQTSSLNGGQFQGPPPPPPSAMLAKADTNGDGSISADEFNTFEPTGPNGQVMPTSSDDMKDNFFKKLDTDGDGTISSAELQAAPPPPPPRFAAQTQSV